jgi:hypothetical protein
MSQMIPKVRTWKVTAVETGRVVFVDTINKRFARWVARENFGMWGKTLKVSVVKETPRKVYCSHEHPPVRGQNPNVRMFDQTD